MQTAELWFLWLPAAMQAVCLHQSAARISEISPAMKFFLAFRLAAAVVGAGVPLIGEVINFGPGS